MTSIENMPIKHNKDYDYLVSLHKVGFKLVPLDINHEHYADWSPIYNNADYWHPNSFNDPVIC
jgi:hypothetical protein